MDIRDILLGGGGVTVVLLSLIQIAPVQLNPWSWIAKRIGRAINAEVLEQVEAMRQRLDGHIEKDEAAKADGKRAFILTFNRQLMNGEKHTREEFWEALAAIDWYNSYCKTHKDYPNERAVHAIRNIGRVYDERQRKNDFLPDR